jgi:type I restriction enzyme, S subunit
MSAVHRLLAEHIDIWTAADKEKKSGRGRSANGADAVYGIKKLRELILELAVRGKLVSQDESDEPASELFKRIHAEKVMLIAGGVIKNDKPLPPVTEDEAMFKIPKEWSWIRLGDVCSYIQRGKGPAYSDNSEFPVISQKCVRWAGLDFSQARFIEPSSLSRYEDIRLLRGGDLLWNSTGTGTIGRACIVQLSAQKQILVADSHVTVVRPIILSSEFLWRWIQSPPVQSKIEDAASGTTNQIELNTSTVVAHLCPLPPLAEQHRIVTKVDELMALCDQLEARHTSAVDAHEKLVSHLLSTLTDSHNAEDFAARWQRIAAYFDTLFTTEASIDALKQTLLQLAVMGKLVPQNLHDEPATELLERIQAEKAKLVKDGKIKKEKPLSAITAEEKPFNLPAIWEWARIGDLVQNTDYGLSEQTFDLLQGVPVLKMGDIQNGKVTLGGQKKVRPDVEGLPALYLETGDLLYNRTNSAELVGKTGIYEGPAACFTFASYLIRIRCIDRLTSPVYLNLVMNSPLFRETQVIPHIKQQCGQANINGTIMKNMLVSVPPFEEQKRIIKKVDDLMVLCDQLKSRVTAVSQLQKKLADALVEQAVA